MRRTWPPCWPLESRSALAVASPALAYDTGPHSELTRDAMTSEGFRADAAGVAQVNNWFVDLYEQTEQEPVQRARRLLETASHRGDPQRALAR